MSSPITKIKLFPNPNIEKKNLKEKKIPFS